MSTPDFDLHGSVNEVLKDVGLTAADSGGKLTFYGQDPIIPAPSIWRHGGDRLGRQERSRWRRSGNPKLEKDRTFMWTSGKLSGVFPVS